MNDCKELLTCSKCDDELYTDVSNRIKTKANILVESAHGTGITLADFFNAMDELCLAAKKAKEIAASKIRL